MSCTSERCLRSAVANSAADLACCFAERHQRASHMQEHTAATHHSLVEHPPLPLSQLHLRLVQHRRASTALRARRAAVLCNGPLASEPCANTDSARRSRPVPLRARMQRGSCVRVLHGRGEGSAAAAGACAPRRQCAVGGSRSAAGLGSRGASQAGVATTKPVWLPQWPLEVTACKWRGVFVWSAAACISAASGDLASRGSAKWRACLARGTRSYRAAAATQCAAAQGAGTC